MAPRERLGRLHGAAMTRIRRRRAIGWRAGVPTRRSAVPPTIASRMRGGMTASMSVSINPGDTAFTSTPCGPNSRASVRVRPMRPAFDAA